MSKKASVKFDCTPIPPAERLAKYVSEKLTDSDRIETNWRKNAESTESALELRDLEYLRAMFCQIVEPREVVELKELRKRFRARYSYEFWQSFITAIADGVVLLKNKVRILNNHQERVTVIAVNPNLHRIYQSKLADYEKLESGRLELINGSTNN